MKERSVLLNKIFLQENTSFDLFYVNELKCDLVLKIESTDALIRSYRNECQIKVSSELAE